MAVDSRGETAVSLFITTHVLMCVQVRLTGHGPEVVARGAAEIPTGTMEGLLVQEPVRLSQVIRSLMRSINVQARSATVVLPSSDYSLRTLRLPEAPLRERSALVRGELEQTAALSIKGGGVDFLWVSAADGGTLPAEVTAYYIGDVIIDSLRATLQRAGLKMDGIEPASLALMRAYLATLPEKQPLALLYVAAGHSDICLYDGVQIRQMRRIPAGWNDMGGTLSPEAARHPNTDNPLRTDWSEDDPPLINFPVRATPESEPTAVGSFLTGEVTRTLAFFAREHGEKVRIEAITVLGPAETARQIARALAPTQSLSVTASDPLPAFDPPRAVASPRANADPSEYAAAIGAVLGRLGQDGGIPVLNIAQQEAFAETRRRAPGFLMAGMAGSTVWMLAALIAAIALTLQQSNAETESAQLTATLDKTRREQATALAYQKAVLDAKAAQAQAQIPAASVLGRVAAAVGPGIALTDLNVTRDGKVTINGNAAGIADVQRFAFALGTGRSIRTPVIETLRQDPKGGLNFHITGTFPQAASPESKEAGGTPH